MSRVGKEPITIPSGVEVNLEGRRVVVKGHVGGEVLCFVW